MKNFFVCIALMLLFAGMLIAPLIADDPQIIQVDGFEEPVAFTGTRAELLLGTFEDARGPVVVVVDTDGNVVLYCSSVGSQFGGLPGGIVRQAEGVLYFMSDECSTSADWRERRQPAS